jgi:hypothetical protein
LARRVDANQKEITETFRKLGATVQIISEIGKGCPDLILGAFGKNYLIEVKDGAKPLSSQKLTPHEIGFFDKWRGQVCIIRSKEEAIKFYQSLNTKIEIIY